MKLKIFSSALLALAVVVGSALHASAQTSASSLVLLYNSLTGNLALQNTLSSTLAIREFTVLTTGNGVDGTPVSGRPGNEGWLYTGTNILPTSAFPSNNNEPGENLNGLWSTSGAANVTNTPVLNLLANPSWSLSNPDLGPVGSYWNLGDIAPTGMTQADLNSRFMTNGGSFSGGYVFGKMTYQLTGTSQPLRAGDVLLVSPVPEPSTYALAFAGLTCGGYVMRRRRRKA